MGLPTPRVKSTPRSCVTMSVMRVDHVSYAAEHDGLKATAERLAKLIGVEPVDGGIHPRFGTRNVIFPLAHERYVEVVEVLDHPASDKAPVRPGRPRRAPRPAAAGSAGSSAVDDIKPGREAPGPRGGRRQPAPPRRHRAPLAPARRQGPDLRPAAAVLRRVGDPRVPPVQRCATPTSRIEGLQIAGDPGAGARVARPAAGQHLARSSTSPSWPRTAPPACSPVTFDTPNGKVTV